MGWGHSWDVQNNIPIADKQQQNKFTKNSSISNRNAGAGDARLRSDGGRQLARVKLDGPECDCGGEKGGGK